MSDDPTADWLRETTVGADSEEWRRDRPPGEPEPEIPIERTRAQRAREVAAQVAGFSAPALFIAAIAAQSTGE